MMRTTGLSAEGFSFLFHMTLNFIVMNREGIYFHRSLKSWQECSFFFPQKSQELDFPSFPPWTAVFHRGILNPHVFTEAITVISV